ncbi:hypothetical protein MIND_00666900 [Mycena indigotica]|uniref:Uncharacterized protein n=1 Tax=Mycena indigotica TaxID=2126181 RepID=A0A8H6SLV7_9AGAR|nr:uncharacterized protein MIND_00666900 [Mycena indigotica]KAF7301031.1 hypothetical protein MIND_00666900 [Mycena indigotica]
MTLSLLLLCRLFGLAVALSPKMDVAGETDVLERAVVSTHLHFLSRRAELSSSTLIAIIVGSVGGVALLITLILLIRLIRRRRSDDNRRDSTDDSQYQYASASVTSPNTPANFMTPISASSNAEYYNATPRPSFNATREKSPRPITADQSLWFSEQPSEKQIEEQPTAQQRPITQNYSLPRPATASFSSILPPTRTLERKSSMQQLIEATGLYDDAPPLPITTEMPAPTPSHSPSPSLSRTRSTPSPSVPTSITPELSAALASRATRLRAASPPSIDRGNSRSPPYQQLPLARQKSEPNFRGSPPSQMRPMLTVAVAPPEPIHPMTLIPRPRESSLSPEQQNNRTPITPVRRRTGHQISASEDTGAMLSRPSSRFSISPVARSFPSMTMNILGLRGQGEDTTASSVGVGARRSRHTRKFGSDVVS